MDDERASPDDDRPRLAPIGRGPDGDRPIALLAGSFDPPTIAHVALAEAWRAETAGDVVFVYAHRTLPKRPGTEDPLLGDEARLEALRRVTAVREGFHAARASHGLIVDQAEAARARWPGARITVLLGSDKARQLFDPVWYQDLERALSRLFAAADVRCAAREGDEGLVGSILSEPAHARYRGRFTSIAVPAGIGAVASSDVRRRLRAGRRVDDLVPPEVLSLIGA